MLNSAKSSLSETRPAAVTPGCGVPRLAAQRNVDRLHVAVEADGDEGDARGQEGEDDLREIDRFLPGDGAHEMCLEQ
jgi:hypothetical protein